jgi:hypothetical protein
MPSHVAWAGGPNVFALIAKLFAGPLIGALSKAYEAKLAADNDESRLIAEAAIKDIERQIADREAAKEIRLATAGFWEMRLIAFAVAAPFAMHAGAVGLDTTFKLGWRIPAYPPPFDQWEGLIILSFFGLQYAHKGFTAIASAIRRR